MRDRIKDYGICLGLQFGIKSFKYLNWKCERTKKRVISLLQVIPQKRELVWTYPPVTKGWIMGENKVQVIPTSIQKGRMNLGLVLNTAYDNIETSERT